MAMDRLPASVREHASSLHHAARTSMPSIVTKRPGMPVAFLVRKAARELTVKLCPD
jgi:hypothetical protein